MRFIVGFLLVTTVVSAEECVDKLKWTTEKGKILVNGQPLVLKGISWYGFEQKEAVVHGLWSHNLSRILDDVKDNGFNAIRVPFSMEMVRKNPRVTKIGYLENPELLGKTAMQLLDTLIYRAAARGLLILLDNHRNSAGEPNPPPLWYDNEYSEKQVLEYWATLISRYDEQWNVFAIDLKNQPRAPATWGDGSATTDWKAAAERMIVRLKDFNGLYFVSGLEWGTKYEMDKPIDTSDAELNKRVVYGPTCNGPAAYMLSEFQEEEFPHNLDDYYSGLYGFLVNQTGQPVVLSEWAVKVSEKGTKDDDWNKWLVGWLRNKCLTNNFYWCLNHASSHSGGGYFDDYRAPVAYRKALLAHVQPNPTKFRVNESNKKICITPGMFPEAHCRY